MSERGFFAPEIRLIEVEVGRHSGLIRLLQQSFGECPSTVKKTYGTSSGSSSGADCQSRPIFSGSIASLRLPLFTITLDLCQDVYAEICRQS